VVKNCGSVNDNNVVKFVVMMNVRFDEVVRKDESKGGKRNERYGC
jgi:hypothetical protein